jgi:vancomycin permeability regulator SanA
MRICKAKSFGNAQLHIAIQNPLAMFTNQYFTFQSRQNILSIHNTLPIVMNMLKLATSIEIQTAEDLWMIHDHYQLTYIGWQEQKRIFSLILHFDIKDEKIWVQYNGTETAIAQVLIDKGVPASDIVLGFHSPFKRQFSGYAIM